MMQNAKWEAIIGLEIHCQLNTHSKLFSASPCGFGADPNTQILPACTGQPGALPVINKEAIRKGILFGKAIKAKIADLLQFDRKSYFYPDSPRNFQITQFYNPLVQAGTVYGFVDGEKRSFAISEAHIEDDSGILRHFSNFSGVDLNRAGMALIEIVSTPCMRSSKEAVSYAMAIQTLVSTLGISTPNMEEGSFRIDLNVSVRKKGEEQLRPKAEIKNLNSFYSLAKAIDYQVEQQIAFYEAYPEQLLTSATYRWDIEKQQTVLMRLKERANDYRYFSEPDLPPIPLPKSFIEEIEKQLPELPWDRVERYHHQLKLSYENSAFLVNDPMLSAYYEEALRAYNSPQALFHWINGEFAGRLKERGLVIYRTKVTAKHVASLVEMIETGKITGKIAKKIADQMIEANDPDPLFIYSSSTEYQVLSDPSFIASCAEKVFLQNPQAKIDFQQGKNRAFGFLVGQIMKACGEKADPIVVNRIVEEYLKSS